MNETQLQQAKALWDYHKIGQSLAAQYDLLLVTGSHDLRVADRGAELADHCKFSYIVVSGGSGRITPNVFAKSEADLFSDRMTELGILNTRIIRETQAEHSGENIALSKEILGDAALSIGSASIVTKPYMERRMLATAERQWPGVNWSVTSPQIAFDDYPTDEFTLHRMVEIMVGNLHRIDVYARRGIQSEQIVPQTVWNAFNLLVGDGFGAHLIRD